MCVVRGSLRCVALCLGCVVLCLVCWVFGVWLAAADLSFGLMVLDLLCCVFVCFFVCGFGLGVWGVRVSFDCGLCFCVLTCFAWFCMLGFVALRRVALVCAVLCFSFRSFFWFVCLVWCFLFVVLGLGL